MWAELACGQKDACFGRMTRTQLSLPLYFLQSLYMRLQCLVLTPPRALHVAPHGKCPDLRDYVSICLVLNTRHESSPVAEINPEGQIVNIRQEDGARHCDVMRIPPASSHIPVRFRCSIIDVNGKIAYSNGKHKTLRQVVPKKRPAFFPSLRLCLRKCKIFEYDANAFSRVLSCKTSTYHL